jgi:hypothetical protein
LVLRGCTAPEELSEGLDVCFLDLQCCRRLRRWLGNIAVRHGQMNLAGTGFTTLPKDEKGQVGPGPWYVGSIEKNSPS